MSERRVVVTGIGVISAFGPGGAPYWDGLRQGRCGIRPITLFDAEGFRSRIAGQVPEIPEPPPLPVDGSLHLSRNDRLALWAAAEALQAAGLTTPPGPTEEFGVVLGAGAGGMLSAEYFREALWRETPPPPDPELLYAFPASQATDLVALLAGARGPRSTVVTACSSSATSIGHAADLIRMGRCHTVLTGGSDAMSRLTYAGFNALRSIDPEPCRPFDRNRKGLSLGEGAAVLVLEELQRARRRGATIIAEVLGYGISCDAYHMTAPESSGDGAYRCMRAALESAGIDSTEIDYINAHGTATRFNDLVETLAIKRLFGRRAHQIPISSSKSMIGHCLGAAGCMEATAAILALQHQIVPPTIHYETPDPQCDLDYVPNEAREVRLRCVLSNSFAFGGNNTSLVLGAPPHEAPA
jgi:3-oxoacyl-[acyl-carrier-protein] synthase II